eukprot:gene9077-10046_t
MDRGMLVQNVESLKFQLDLNRIPLSKSCNEIMQYCLQNGATDPLVNPNARKSNPWAEKSTCNVL